MTAERRRTLLFLPCAAVLLAAGYAWGYGRAYDTFYSADASLDRELTAMDFNGRVLHHVNAGQAQECRRELVTQLSRQAVYVRGFLAAASPESRHEGEKSLRQAERVMAGQPLANPVAAAPLK